MDHANSAISRGEQAKVFKAKYSYYLRQKNYSFQNVDTFILRDSIFS